ncbi:hypothetical protein BN1708_000287 [Verticillium longisporum]|uniref:Uncharacterized protein n=1 Tax=Verticillium longisporum TaxID=100787 RepID=A0A0G4KCJ6_VERLO|nr:hypothetical protein BN1708_000287 [Verticillium longisporum]
MKKSKIDKDDESITPNIIFPIPRSTTSQQQDLFSPAQSGSAASPVGASIKPTGAWSQSKAWVSERSRQQAAFKKVQANLGRINAADSPAVPRTLAEFLELKKWKAKRDQRCLLRKISLLEMNQGLENITPDAGISLITPNSTDKTDEGGKAAGYPSNDTTRVPKADDVAENERENLDQKDDKGTLGASGTSSGRITTEIPKPPDIDKIVLRRLLDGKTFEDNKSPVFASDTCWNVSYNDSSGSPVQRRVDWPSKADLQEYGDMRSAAGMGAAGKPVEEEVKKSKAVEKKQAARFAAQGKVDPALEKQFEAGRLYAVIASRPGQSGRCDGYILEGEELAFYQRKLHK